MFSTSYALVAHGSKDEADLQNDELMADVHSQNPGDSTFDADLLALT